jgi:hypothetical protein
MIFTLDRRAGLSRTLFTRAAARAHGLSRNHAVGQASRRSLTLNHRLEAGLLKRVGSHQKRKGNFQMETGATPVLRKRAGVSRAWLLPGSG